MPDKCFEVNAGSVEGNVLLYVEIDNGASQVYSLPMASLHNSFEARAVAGAIQEAMQTALKTIRRNAYRKGYEDGRKHRKQRKGFWGDWDIDPNTGV